MKDNQLGLPYSNDSTSREAAQSMEPHVQRLEAEVLSCLRFCGPMACFEVERFCNMAHTTASARIRGLVVKQLVEDSGDRKPTPSGRNAILWRAVKR